MKITTKTKINTVLELTEEEAAWLKTVMQNPLHGQFPDEESREDYEMRYLFFNSLPKFE